MRIIFKYVIVPAVSTPLFISVEELVSLFGVNWWAIFKQAEATRLLLVAVRKGNQELIKTCIANGADTSRGQKVREAAFVLFMYMSFIPFTSFLGQRASELTG